MAVELPPGLRRSLSELGASHPLPGVRWLPAENLHITVVFLGDVADADVDGLIDALRQAARLTDPFSLEVLHARAAPDRHPRMIWALVSASEPLLRLSRDLHGAARRLAPKRRPPLRGFAHITLARFRSPPPGLQPMPLDAAGGIAVAAVRLMRSRLSPAGASYQAVAEIALGRAPT